MAGEKEFDVVIIGGSYAGLSAAMALGRSLRRVMVVDSGSPCNKQTPHSHNFITQDGEKPHAIAAKAKKQVLNYTTVQFCSDEASRVQTLSDQFEITTRGDELFHAKKIILATGLKDIMPDIKGLADCWGISVIHCPYCHGYEFKQKKTGIMANGERAFHLVSLIKNLTDEITLFTQGKPGFSTEQAARLKKNNINVIETGIAEIDHCGGYIKNAMLSDGVKIEFDVMYAALPFTQRSDIAASLGCEFTEQGHIKTDMLQKTSVTGVFACGDNSSMMRSVAYAVATGNIAGAMANKELADEEF